MSKKKYIKHYTGTFDNIKHQALLHEFGPDAYSLYWYIMELMAAEEPCSLPYRTKTFDLIYFETRAKCDVKSYVDKAIEYGLFVRDGDRFCSPALEFVELEEMDCEA